MEVMTQEQKFEMLFSSLILSLQTAALQQLGKLKNPLTDQIEKDLEQARMTIDMLEMIKERTKGNLGGTEGRFLTQVVADLQLNYIDEWEKEKKKKAEDADGKSKKE